MVARFTYSDHTSGEEDDRRREKERRGISDSGLKILKEEHYKFWEAFSSSWTDYYMLKVSSSKPDAQYVRFTNAAY